MCFVRNTVYEILTPDGFKSFDGLNAILGHTLRVFAGSRLLLEASTKHRILTNTGFKTLAELRTGDIVLTKQGTTIVTRIEDGSEYALYDPINVAHPEQAFYTGDVVSHNCDFMGSANTLVAPWKLAQLSYVDPIEVRDKLLIYKKPIHRGAVDNDGNELEPHVYIILVDIAQGQEQDDTVLQVIDITQNPFEQVAIYRNNLIKPMQLPPVIRDLGRWYNSAFVLIEINGEGLPVADTLGLEMEYEGLIQIYPHPKKGQMLSSGFNPKARLGLKMTEATKRIGCTGLKSLIENDKLFIRDYETMRQLTTFVAKVPKNGSMSRPRTYEAEAGNHDDCITPLVLLGWLTLQSAFENYVGLSMRQLLTEGREPLSLEPPALGIMGDLEQQQIVGKVAGYDVVDDPSFWLTDEDKSNNWL